MADAASPLVGLGSAFVQAKSLQKTQGFISDMMAGPEIPDPVTPDAPVESGSEGIRSGEMARQSKRRALGQAYLTKGQDRGTGATLGGSAVTLG